MASAVQYTEVKVIGHFSYRMYVKGDYKNLKIIKIPVL